MSKMLLLCYDMLPVWLRPQYTSRVESDRGKLLFGNLASGVSFQHGSQKFGIATGSTPNIYHLSECALYGDSAVKLIDEGLWKAVHASPKVLGVLESTGRSNKGWWAGLYFSKRNWPQCRMFPMFLLGTPAWIFTPCPPTFAGCLYPRTGTPTSTSPTRRQSHSVRRGESHVKAPPARRTNSSWHSTHRPWTMPIDQQWYWEWNHREAKEKGNDPPSVKRWPVTTRKPAGERGIRLRPHRHRPNRWPPRAPIRGLHPHRPVHRILPRSLPRLLRLRQGTNPRPLRLKAR